MNVSTHFKEAGWLNKIGHVVESLHVPDVYKDFDAGGKVKEKERTPEDYKVAYNSVLKETLWMTSLQMVSNLLLLGPLLATGVTLNKIGKISSNMNFLSASKVSEKHSALVDNIGTYPEEDNAYELLNNLSLALPLLVVVTWVLDALLAAAYLKWLHPWKIILQEVSSHIFGF